MVVSENALKLEAFLLINRQKGGEGEKLIHI